MLSQHLFSLIIFFINLTKKCVAHKVMGIRHSIVILLLVLCASLSTYGQTEEEVKQRYKKFIRQHVFGAMNVQRCDSEIRTRHITGSQNDNSCKEVNTFILAITTKLKQFVPEEVLDSLKQRRVYEHKPFPVVTCTLISGERHPNVHTEDTSPLERLLWGVQATGQHIMKKVSLYRYQAEHSLT